MELESYARDVLAKAGVKKGQTVLDFGCGPGTYTIPAAKIVGQKGKVYALERNNADLTEMRRKTESAGLHNIEIVDTGGSFKIDLSNESIDIVLLFDVLYSHHFPTRAEERNNFLGEIHRILKPRGLVLVYPKHATSDARREMELADFTFQSEYHGILIHRRTDLEEGKVLILTKM
jgi:ubiquinone/menaquinone biosynthesis C-methylase UbiE